MRGRPLEPRLTREGAAAIRKWLAHIFGKRPELRISVLDEMPGEMHRRAHLGSRSERWLQRACSEFEDLPRATAVEILLRLRRCGVRVPENIAATLQRVEPAAIVFPEESSPLADRIAEIIEHGEGIRLSALTKNALTEYFAGFEKVASTGIGKQALHLVRSAFGRDWKGHMTRLRHVFGVLSSGDRYSTPSPIQMLENEFMTRIAKQ